MGGGVSIDACVENFSTSVVNKNNSSDKDIGNCVKGNSLSLEEKNELKKLAELIFNENNVSPEDVSQSLVELKRELFDKSNNEDVHVKHLKEEFLKYLTIQVMQYITKKAVEDVFKDLLASDDLNDGIESLDNASKK